MLTPSHIHFTLKLVVQQISLLDVKHNKFYMVVSILIFDNKIYYGRKLTA